MIVQAAGVLVHVNRIPAKCIQPMKCRRARRWCFGCRKRTLHRWMVINQEWYEPEAFQECVECGHDRTRFPV